MTATLAVRFPLGRYHATPWDRSVNEGAVEWPPSPWRLLRTFVATWYTRWPDLPVPVLDGLLDALGSPPAYRTPPARPGHTRHYLPDIDHKKGETGSTDLTLDPYLSIPRDEDLLVQWPVSLTDEQRDTLAKLVELIPYLGRADSVCEARLLDADPVPDETWWQPSATGPERVRLLAPTTPVRRPVLEATTLEVRKGRRTLPPETRWVDYSSAPVTSHPVTTSPRVDSAVTTIRFAVVSNVPLPNSRGILLADEIHRLVVRRLDGGREGLLGHQGAATDHKHAHWIPLATGPEASATVSNLLIWVPGGLMLDEISEMISIRRTSGRRGNYQVKGFPDMRLLLQATGTVSQVAPELCGPARRWRSLTPYLPVRYPKRQTLDQYATADVQTELSYRQIPAASVTRMTPEEALSDRWALDFRRYRLTEDRGAARPGLGLALEFPEPVDGPITLGKLSHFGYGVFIPEPT
jgi:CRISPR-associated protein Csb2